jgi:hypothetical protein
MVIEGDPKKPGPYVLRYKVPAREMSTPHFHPEDRFITVIQGTWWTGTGETFDSDSMIPLSPGSFMKHPAGGAHFDGSKDAEVSVQVVGNGPSGLTSVHPEMGMSIKYEESDLLVRRQKLWQVPRPAGSHYFSERSSSPIHFGNFLQSARSVSLSPWLKPAVC